MGDDPQVRLTSPVNAAIIAALLEAEAEEKQQTWRVAQMQILVILIASAIAYGIKATPQFAVAVLSGGGVAVLNSVLIAWRMSQADRRSTHDAQLQLRLLYFYATERFILVVVLLGVSIVILKLPLIVLGGFVLGQAVLLSARLFLRIKKKDSE
jgi:hypothetical protein